MQGIGEVLIGPVGMGTQEGPQGGSLGLPDGFHQLPPWCETEGVGRVYTLAGGMATMWGNRGVTMRVNSTICYGIVEQHGGIIAVQSELGQGTTVRVCFPRVT